MFAVILMMYIVEYSLSFFLILLYTNFCPKSN
nr:MAG TPA: hypothetical protein [Caudoviricetes sp.]